MRWSAMMRGTSVGLTGPVGDSVFAGTYDVEEGLLLAHADAARLEDGHVVNVALREFLENRLHDLTGSRRYARRCPCYDYLSFVELSGLGVLLGLRLYLAEIFKTLDCHVQFLQSGLRVLVEDRCRPIPV